MRKISEWWGNAWVQIFIALSTVLIATRFGGLFSLQPGNISAFWPANALLFSAIQLMPPKTRSITLLLALPVYAAAELNLGYPLTNAIVYSFANVFEVAVLLGLLKATSTRSLAFDSTKDLFTLLVLGLAAALCGGLVGALGAQSSGAAVLTIWMRWALADFFGYCLCVPLALTWPQWRGMMAERPTSQRWEFAILLALLLVVAPIASGVYIFGAAAPLGAQFLPMPILLWAALRFGPPGGALATLIAPVIAFYGATRGYGLFALEGPEQSIESLQWFFASLVITVMTVATLTSERRRSIAALKQEVAERRLAEEALSNSEARYRRIVDTTTEGVCLTDSQLAIVFVNARMGELLGYRPEEMLGRIVTEFIQPEDMQDHLLRMENRRRGIAENYDRRFRHKSGKVVLARASASPIFDEEGQFTGSIAMFTDITEQAKTEHQLRLLGYALDEVAESILLMGENDPHFLYVNESSARALGYRKDELIGGMGVYDIDPEWNPERWKAFWPELCERRQIQFESVHKTREGRVFPVEITSNYFEFDGRIYNLAICRDISERKRTEVELNHYRDSLEETVQERTAQLKLARDAAQTANRAKSVFLANMSHELRTPLNAILGFSELISKNAQLPDQLHQYVDIINRSGEHLLSLINDVLEMSRIEAGRIELESRSFDLGTVVRDVIDLVRKEAEQKGLTLQVDQSPQFPRFVTGDQARIRQILINLLGNAIKYTSQGGVALRLGVNNSGHLVIEVEDTGIGIAVEDQQRIFEPFVQLGDPSLQKDTGLGLSIIRQFVNLMGGTIRIQSAPGRGAVFTVDLPLTDTEQQDMAARSVEKTDVVGLASGQPEYRILIAEDQEDNQLLLKTLMQDLALPTRITVNGEECVRMFEEWHPHLIWMDRQMPVMDGIEATCRIRALPGGDTVKIVAVTASVLEKQQEEVKNAGMDDFVSKPYRLEEIYDCLARQLGLQYHYDTGNKPPTNLLVDPRQLAQLPAHLRDQLKEALLSLESAKIEEALTTIHRHNPELGARLQVQAAQYDYPTILAALHASPDTV